MRSFRKLPYLILMIVSIIFLGSCTKKKIVQKQFFDPNIKPGGDTMDKFNKEEIPFKWLVGRAKVNIQTGGNSYSVASSILIKKDSIIFGNAILLLEVGKLLINSDSATILNGIQKEVMVAKKSDFKKLFAMDELTITSLQKLFLGLYPQNFNKMDFQITSGGSETKLRRETPKFLEEFVIIDPFLRMSRYLYKVSESKSLQIEYNVYDKYGNDQIFLPAYIVMTIMSPEKSVITMEISNWEFENNHPLNFKIPTSYNRKTY